jgi:hypothetical protein
VQLRAKRAQRRALIEPQSAPPQKFCQGRQPNGAHIPAGFGKYAALASGAKGWSDSGTADHHRAPRAAADLGVIENAAALAEGFTSPYRDQTEKGVTP